MSERRKYQRVEFRGNARVLHGWHNVVRCDVVDVSQGGACLEVEATVPLPDQFDLCVRQPRLEHTCRVIWRDGTRVGVSFQTDWKVG